MQDLTRFALEPREVLVLPAPRPAVVLVLPDRNERLAARAARPFGDGVATTGGVQPPAMTPPVLPIRQCVAFAAPRVATVRRGSPDGERLSVLDLSASPAALLAHPAGVSHRGPRPLRDLAVARRPSRRGGSAPRSPLAEPRSCRSRGYLTAAGREDLDSTQVEGPRPGAGDQHPEPPVLHGPDLGAAQRLRVIA